MDEREKFVDLHVHTTFSDGTFTPEEVVKYAKDVELSAVAITDHDSVDGILPAIAAAKDSSLEIIPGVELTAEYNDFEVHILGLLIEWNSPWFADKLKEIRIARYERMKRMIEKLNAKGIDIALDDVLAFSGADGALGRLHLARALNEKGIVKSIKEAFDRFIGKNKPCFEKRMIISPEEALTMVNHLKGISVLAHPGLMMHDEIIPELVQQGLKGIEVLHTDHKDKSALHYRTLAKKYRLLMSGGSDCHGEGKGMPLMGWIKVPYILLENLKLAKNKCYGHE
ncbi:MAG: PHP domain-containing protein [Candidatus Omnitrophica bacterium]|nr:PHP domain-containing protein [Candidatus Omnitrophota bacterium]MCG2702814.1 PHP domain-containing protein [Candidatus Omnitrophota bacterium]